ncbi:protein of unknown function [Cupriavidus taiwanensis]|uniref:Uncharacterized protein n=1 Tax=Cupriavidus taiwanensis TaxID=164546 RepID=A0A9Q7XSP6_9BURK|nr:protein of unknown function [Cupriavidus taiwanensis]
MLPWLEEVGRKPFTFMPADLATPSLY